MLFIITIVFSIPGALLYGPLLNDPKYIVGPGADTQVAFGAFLEIIVAIANIGTAVTLFPILKRQHESVALGYAPLASSSPPSSPWASSASFR